MFSDFASKGEADLLMFKDERYADYLKSYLTLNSNDNLDSENATFKGCVLSKSIAGCIDDDEYFKIMLKNFKIKNIK